MRLEEGMYVRTKDGYITKIINNNDIDIVKTDDNSTQLKSEIKKASFNIMDLIEAGDYVDGELVLNIDKFKDGSIYLEFSESRYIDNIKNKIQSIVTKEQFEQVKYEVKDEDRN